MTSISSLPPELLLQIFHWATYDHALYENRPSWRNYDLTHYDGEDPWPTPSESKQADSERTVRSLASTCTRWRVLATEFKWRHIMVSEMSRLKHYLDGINKLLQKGSDGQGQLECPVRRITLTMAKERVWTEGDTEMVVSLIRICPNLEVLINWIFADGEMHAAGPILLQSLVDSCPRLKRLHWKTMGCMQILPSAWSSILGPSSLRTSLVALEVNSPPAFPAHGSTPAPSSPLELPSLHCLQLSANEDNASFISLVADEWQLPSLTSLYLTSSHHPTIRGVISLLSAHGSTLTTLAFDRSASADIPLEILPPAARLQELIYYGHNLRDTESIPFTSLSSLIVVLDLMGGRSLDLNIFAALKLLYQLPSNTLAGLKEVVFLQPSFDALEEPHPINAEGLTENQHRWTLWGQQGTLRLVNRNGVRLYRLVGTDGEQG